MLGFSLRLFLLITAVFTLSATAMEDTSLGSKQNRLILSYDRSWLPYIYKNEQGELKGLDAELLTRVLSQMNYQLELFPVPENRLREVISHGNIDVAIAAFKNEQRQKSNWFSIPYRTEKTVIAYLDNKHPEFSGKDIYTLIKGNYSVGLNNGAWYGPRFEQQIKIEHQYQCFHIEGISRRLKMLAAGRIDLIVGDHLALKAEAQALGLSNVIFSDIAVFEDDTHFIFSKKRVDQHFMRQFNSLLHQALKTSP